MRRYDKYFTHSLRSDIDKKFDLRFERELAQHQGNLPFRQNYTTELALGLLSHNTSESSTTDPES